MPGRPRKPSAYFPRTTDQMRRLDPLVGLSDEEEIAAQKSFLVYCGPVEFYNILKCRAEKNPSFLRRCLSYKIQEKDKMRIHLLIKVPEIRSTDAEVVNLFPLHVLIGRRAFGDKCRNDSHGGEFSYSYSRLCILKNPQAHVKFVLPEVTTLAEEAKSRSVEILFVCQVDSNHLSNGTVSPDHHLLRDGHGLCGKLSLDFLFLTWEMSDSRNFHQGAEMTSVADLHSCFLKWEFTKQGKKLIVQKMKESAKLQVQANLSAFAVGSRERSSYDIYSLNDNHVRASSHIIQLRAGNVIFNYRYYNDKLQKTEVTEDFCCPFCLMKCASFKGLRCHLPASHDLFNFEFWVNEEQQTVNVSLKADKWKEEILKGCDLKKQTFFFHSMSLKHKRRVITQTGSCIRPSTYEPPILALALANGSDGASSATARSSDDLESVQSEKMLQLVITPKLHVDRSDFRNRTRLLHREFFHSQSGQPMDRAQVFGETDSEDEVDDYTRDVEDQRMLDDFVDVTIIEKQLMHMWNSFVRRQRVLANAHVPWACEAFSDLHKQELAKVPALKMCWKLFMIKLWNHGLLDARTMNSCNLNLEQCVTPQESE